MATSRSANLVSAIALAGILSLGTGISWASAATVAPDQPSASQQIKQESTTRRKRQRLPTFLSNAVRQDLGQKLGRSSNKFRVVASEQATFPDSCLGLPGADELCAFVQTEGWKITLSDGRQRWIYRTDLEGRIIRLETPIVQSQVPDDAVVEAVKQAASEQLQVPTARLQVAKMEPQTWSDGCLGLGTLSEICSQALVPGWQLTVTANGDRLVYRTSQTGSVVRLDEAASRTTTARLPQSAASAVLREAAQRTGMKASDLRITQSKSIVADGCLNLPAPGEVCTENAQNVWQVTVVGGQQQLVYRTNRIGSQVRFDAAASRIAKTDSLEPGILSDQEIPPALREGVLFRAIATGGISGKTYQTTLMEDGQLITLESGSGDKGVVAQPQVRQLSRRQVQQFLQLLQDQQFDQFDRLNYPPAKGSADVMIVTLSSPSSNTRYADSTQASLPQPLKEVIDSWNQLARLR